MPRRKKKPTLLKFRVIPLVRMPKSKMFQLLKQACETGIVPPEIEVQTLDWWSRKGGRWRPGATLNARDAEELRNCYEFLTGAVTKRDIRVERVR